MQPEFETIFDANQRQILPGDIIRTPHFRDPRGEQYYLHHYVRRMNSDWTPDIGFHLRGCHIDDHWDIKHSYSLSGCLDADVEVIDSSRLLRDRNGRIMMWNERPKGKTIWELGWRLE